MALSRLAAVFGAFCVPGALRAATPVGDGHIHASWRVETDLGEVWFLQQLNRHVFPDPQGLARLGAQLADWLAARAAAPPADLRDDLRGFVVPAPVATRDGGLVYTDVDGNPWRLSTWVDGARAGVVTSDEADLHAAGRAFGVVHRLLADLEPQAVTPIFPGFHDTAARLRALDAAVQADRAARADGCATEIAALRARAPLACALADLDLPVVVVHNDAKLANVLLAARTADGAPPRCRAVVDWDTAGPGLRLHDLGDLVRSTVSTAAEDEPDPARVVVDPARWRAVVSGYLATAGPLLTAAEREHLLLAAQVIVLEQAARFLTDHLDGDRYYRVDDPGHNLRRARAQRALLDELCARQMELII